MYVYVSKLVILQYVVTLPLQGGAIDLNQCVETFSVNFQYLDSLVTELKRTSEQSGKGNVHLSSK